MVQFLSTDNSEFEAAFSALLSAKREDSPDVDAVVAGIIADVRARGDAALIELTAKFDKLELTPETLAFSAEEIDAACATVPPAEREALELAAARIRAYHERQLPEDARWTDASGAELGWRWTPVEADCGRQLICPTTPRACPREVVSTGPSGPPEGGQTLNGSELNAYSPRPTWATRAHARASADPAAVPVRRPQCSPIITLCLGQTGSTANRRSRSASCGGG